MRLLKVLLIVAIPILGGRTEARMTIVATDLYAELSRNATTDYSQRTQPNLFSNSLGHRFPQILVAQAATPMDKATEYPPLDYVPEGEEQTGHQAKPAESRAHREIRQPVYPPIESSASSRPPEMTRPLSPLNVPGGQYSQPSVDSGGRMPYRPDYSGRMPPGMPDQRAYSKGTRSGTYPNVPGYYAPYAPSPYFPWSYPSPPR